MTKEMEWALVYYIAVGVLISIIGFYQTCKAGVKKPEAFMVCMILPIAWALIVPLTAWEFIKITRKRLRDKAESRKDQ